VAETGEEVVVAAGLAEAWRTRLAGDVGERVAQVMTSERDLVHDTTSLTILALLPLRTLSLAYLPSNRLSFTNNGVIANRVRCVCVRAGLCVCVCVCVCVCGRVMQSSEAFVAWGTARNGTPVGPRSAPC
jgi:hypothetical protein